MTNGLANRRKLLKFKAISPAINAGISMRIRKLLASCHTIYFFIQAIKIFENGNDFYQYLKHLIESIVFYTSGVGFLTKNTPYVCISIYQFPCKLDVIKLE